ITFLQKIPKGVIKHLVIEVAMRTSVILMVIEDVLIEHNGGFEMHFRVTDDHINQITIERPLVLIQLAPFQLGLVVVLMAQPLHMFIQLYGFISAAMNSAQHHNVGAIMFKMAAFIAEYFIY